VQSLKAGLTCVVAFGAIVGASQAAMAAGKQCPEERSLRSTDSRLETKLTFVNTTNAPVRIYWLNYQGRREFYSNVAPGRNFAVDTFATHPWVATDSDEDCIGAYMPQPRPSVIQVR